jgi:hypothetical protein
VRHHVVHLIRLLGTLTGADRALEAEPGVGGVDHLEHHQRVASGLALGVGPQVGPLGDPGIPDLAAAAVVDEHADGVLPGAVGEGHGQRLLPTADVGVVPAVPDLRGADRAGPRGIGQVVRAEPVGRLAGGGAQARRADRGEHAQQGERLRSGRRLGGGHQRRGEGLHQRGLAGRRRSQRTDQVGSPELGVDRVVKLAEDLARLGQHPVEGFLHGDRREQAEDVGFRGMVGIHAVQDKPRIRPGRGPWPGWPRAQRR